MQNEEELIVSAAPLLERLGTTVEALQELIETVAVAGKYTEDKAGCIVGTYMQAFNAIPASQAALDMVEAIKLKNIPDMTEEEISLLLQLGIIRRKKMPFKALANTIGRNALCPCNSGKKYKHCCLESVKSQDLERYKTQYRS